MTKILFILAPVTWFLYLLLIDLPMIVIGFFVCAVLAARGKYEKRWSTRWSDRKLLQWSPRWAYPWGNEEDGIDGTRGLEAKDWPSLNHAKWLNDTKDGPQWRRIFFWSAWRNTNGNARFIRPLGFLIDPRIVRWIGNCPNVTDESKAGNRGFLWFIARHGFYSGGQFAYRGRRVRIGWHIEPKDRDGVSRDDHRSRGVPFKLQIRNDKS